MFVFEEIRRCWRGRFYERDPTDWKQEQGACQQLIWHIHFLVRVVFTWAKWIIVTSLCLYCLQYCVSCFCAGFGTRVKWKGRSLLSRKKQKWSGTTVVGSLNSHMLQFKQLNLSPLSISEDHTLTIFETFSQSGFIK